MLIFIDSRMIWIAWTSVRVEQTCRRIRAACSRLLKQDTGTTTELVTRPAATEVLHGLDGVARAAGAGVDVRADSAIARNESTIVECVFGFG